MTDSGRTAPPSQPPWYAERPHLRAALLDIGTHRLTAVVAGAGYGKTSLLTAWATECGAAWLTIERGDRALASLVPSLASAVRRRAPGFAIDPAAALGGASEGESPDRAEVVAASLLESIERAWDAGSERTIVLDDIHRLEPSSPGARLVEALVLQAPPHLHVVVAGRDRPPFPIERLRARGEVATIGADALAFTTDEVAVLAADLGATGEPGLADRIVEMTSGWPAAVRLAIEAYRSGRIPAQPPASATAGDRELFDYLAEDVFAGEPAEVIDFIRKLSVFPRFTVGLAEALGVDDAAARLDELLARGLFVAPAHDADGWFTIHALVRRYARARLATPRADEDELIRRAARWLESSGHLTEAAYATAALGDATSIGRFLGEHGRSLLASGGAADVVALDAALETAAAAQSVPPVDVDDLVGEALIVSGDLDAARRRLERGATDGPLPSRRAWLLGRIHWERGDLAEARDVFARAGIDGHDPHDVLVLSYLASAHWALGDVSACRDVTSRAVAMAEASGDDRSIAAALNPLAVLTIQADPPAAIAHFRRAIAAARSCGDVFQLIRLSTNVGTVLEAQGRYAEALDHQDESVRLAELIGWPAALATSLRARGFTRFRLGRVDEAMADLEAARATWERIGSGRVAWALRNIGWAHRQRGAIAPARSVLERALDLSTRQGDVQMGIFVRAELARLLVDEEPETATRFANDAVADATRLEYALPDARLAAGWVSLARGDAEMAAAHAAAAESGGRSASEPATVAEAMELEALATADPARSRELLAEAVALWTELGDVPGQLRSEVALGRLSVEPVARARGRAAEHELQGLGFRLAQAARVAGVLSVLRPGAQGGVAVRTLGGFAVIRDGRTVELSQWRSRKARDLLKILVARGGRPVAREAVAELLWPDEAPDRLANRLSVAVATLRGVLDPGHRHRSDRYVGGDQEAIWLQPGTVAVDVDAFLADARAALPAAAGGADEPNVDLLEAAEAAYGGDFLEEDPFADWAVGTREQARATYIDVLRALAVVAGAKRDAQQSTRYLLRILERDAYDEEAHLQLVVALDGAGRRGEARRRYRLYASAMRDLGVEPVPFPAAAGRA